MDSFLQETLYLRQVRVAPAVQEDDGYFARLPVVQNLAGMGGLTFRRPVTFFVGENGTGKSTLLEAIATAWGFNPEGGTVNFNFSSSETHSQLYQHLTLAKGHARPRDGFFLRAESFYNVATEIERMDRETMLGPRLANSYGGRSLHGQSHGESFMALVLNRFGGKGLYILDEPEAALSPSRQMALLTAIHNLVNEHSQFIISTHSPILMAYPDADIYELTEEAMTLTPYEETEHYQVTKRFLDSPGRMMRYLFEGE